MDRKILLIALAAIIFLVLVLRDGSDDSKQDVEVAESVETVKPALRQEASKPPYEIVIDAWLTSWSEAQTESVRGTCLKEPGCDPNKYTPSARPQTTFGWNGAARISSTADWARGPRYWVTANGRNVLIYLEGNRVVGAYLETDDGGRRNICRDDECTPRHLRQSQ